MKNLLITALALVIGYFVTLSIFVHLFFRAVQ